MAEPRSLSVAKDNWLTDARAYNLIWLGRWLERAEGVWRGAWTPLLGRLYVRGGGCGTLIGLPVRHCKLARSNAP